MSYQVLARKYRPQTFEEIVGQAHIATTLTNALKSQKVAHAYLFAGPRGVGKTTTARILAKALNCAKGPTAVPCNACDSCLRIAQGQEMVDVLEIDAASNRGIEEIRELRENVRYAPARSRFKVYIVDEAHQITHDAFNAFLKTLEEPPEHAVFILATTEPQKIPATILSRCQLFRFKRVGSEEITKHLEKILKSEKVAAEPAALLRLGRAAGGSVRDGLSLLDQALAFASGALTAKQVEVLLGFLPDEFLEGFVSAILERKPAGVLEWVKQLVEEGWDIPQFVRDFREFLRQTMVEQLSQAEGQDKGTKGQRDGAQHPPSLRPSVPPSLVLQMAGRPVSLPEVLHIIKVMGQCVDEMRWNDNPRLTLELYSLRLTQPFVDAGELLRRIEQLEKSAGGQGSMGDDRASSSPAVSHRHDRLNADRFADGPCLLPETGSGGGRGSMAPPLASGGVDSPPAAAGNDDKAHSSSVPSFLRPSSPPTPTAALTPSSARPLPRSAGEGIQDSAPLSPAPSAVSPSLRPSVSPSDLWKRLLGELWKKPAVASQMERATLKSADDAEWVIGFADAFALASVQRNQAFLEEAVAALLGHAVKIRFVQDVPDRREGEEALVVGPPTVTEERRAVAQDARVQKVLDVFKGRVRPEASD